jgi:hypothetical protein
VLVDLASHKNKSGKKSYLVHSELALLQLGELGREKLKVLSAAQELASLDRVKKDTATYNEICLGARGSFGAFSVLLGPARMVSLK